MNENVYEEQKTDEGFIEYITIDIPLYELTITKRFLPIEFITDYHSPVEYISDDGYIYLLQIDKTDDIEEWYVVFTSPEVITKYLNGDLSTRQLILNGISVYIGIREEDRYGIIVCNRTLLNDIVNGFIRTDELPSDKAKASYKKEDLDRWIKF